MISHNVSKENQGSRIDLYMTEIIPDLTRSKIQHLIKKKQILINGKPVKPSYLLKGTECINYDIENVISYSKNSDKIIFEEMSLDILFEDKSILVINKKAGLVVHPGSGNYSGTLLNGVINKIDQTSFESIPGLVHRLDKETSGVIIIAKDYKSHSFIANQFEERTIVKQYHALVWGNLNDSGTIEGNIARNNRDRKSFILTKGSGRYSKTDYKLISKIGPISHIDLYPTTGRTHQIRVHMKSIGHPILSDVKYSGGNSMIKSFHVKYTNILKRVMKTMNRVALHAKSIVIVHPLTKRKVKFSAPIPEDMLEAIKLLEIYESI